MKKRLFTLITYATLCLSMMAQKKFTFGTHTAPDGQTIEIDNKGFIINGHHVIPVMGEMHYSRVPERDWRREIRKMKAGGITVLSTYVFWNHHEAEEGKWDWSGNKNLRKFIELCTAEKMPVVLRVGPFCHGEVYQGGFPTWLVNKSISDSKNYKLRTTAPGFLHATANLYNNIFAQVNGLLWKDGGAIIGMQLENECRGPWGYYAALKNQAQKTGFDLPFYTRTGWPKLNGKEVFGEMLPLYGDYADGFWDRKLTDMPGDYKNAFIMKGTRLSSVIATESLGANQNTEMNQSDLSYPYLTCELGGGMMPAYHRRINMSGKEIKPLVICKLGSGSNLPGYYMYHGGSNPLCNEHTMGETQDSKTTNYNDMPYVTYDFQSPLGEMGQPNTTAFNESRLLHQMLSDWGELLCTSDIDTLSEHYARRGAFEFYNDYVRILNENGKSYIMPRNLPITINDKTTATIDWAKAEPFCIADNTVFLVEIKGLKPSISINGKRTTPKLNRPFSINGQTFCILSREKAYTTYKIDGHIVYSQHGGIIYKNDSAIVEEYWQKQTDDTPSVKVIYKKKADASAPRKVSLGSQKVAAMPADKDFEQAAVYDVSISNVDTSKINDIYIYICYKGDVARMYADGKLVEDNFWNGKPMLVRLSDIYNKKAELRILPLSKEYPIYLQAQQKAELDKVPNGILLSLDNIGCLERITEKVK